MKKISRVVFCDMQTTKANSQWGLFLEMWLCSRLSRGHGEPRQANLRPTKRQRWPGKSGSLPSVLQRQRDVRGRWPFPANQREICGEERTPPSTFAQEVMRFPYLCWLMEVWRYLYPFWLKTRIQRLIFCFVQKGGTPKLHQWSLFIIH